MGEESFLQAKLIDSGIISKIIKSALANDPRRDFEQVEGKDFNTLEDVEADFRKKTKDIKLTNPDL